MSGASGSSGGPWSQARCHVAHLDPWIKLTGPIWIRGSVPGFRTLLLFPGLGTSNTEYLWQWWLMISTRHVTPFAMNHLAFFRLTGRQLAKGDGKINPKWSQLEQSFPMGRHFSGMQVQKSQGAFFIFSACPFSFFLTILINCIRLLPGEYWLLSRMSCTRFTWKMCAKTCETVKTTTKPVPSLKRNTVWSVCAWKYAVHYVLS